jgi:hypothetical protein
MIEAEIRKLAEQVPDHPLSTLEEDIWVGVAERELSVRASRTLLLVQAALLTAALIGSFAVGQYWGSSHQAGNLDVFSPRMALSASRLLVGDQP